MPYTFNSRSRSRFLFPIRKALRQNRERLVSGQPITIQLESEEGYKGTYICKINLATSMITANYEYEDETRFPARIKAAAIAMCLEGIEGNFQISHDKGKLAIRRL